MISLKDTNLFTILTKFLIIILPFYVVIKVYFDKVIGFGFFGFFIKELVLILLFFSLLYEYFFAKNIKKIKFDLIDYLIFAFIFYWLAITILNWLWFSSIIYGGRYDFLWFVVFLIFRHGRVLIKEKISSLLRLFLIWWSISLFLWIVVKFIVWEEILSLFWFTIQVAEFWFGWGVPIYQWVEASQIRRFQWILDSPLAMGYFLILFSGIFLHINRKKIKDFSIFIWISILFCLVFLTYSRAAMLGIIISSFILFIVNYKYLIKYFKKYMIVFWICFILISSSLSYMFQDKFYNVFFREGSTNGHITRMANGIDRFYEKPFWAWLASSGPAYRKVIKSEITLETDRYYIPESRFIQILIEWWIVYLTLFLYIFFLILKNLYRNIYIFLMIISVLVMNMFLHVFEYTYITILLFLFLGLLYRENSFNKKRFRRRYKELLKTSKLF